LRKIGLGVPELDWTNKKTEINYYFKYINIRVRVIMLICEEFALDKNYCSELFTVLVFSFSRDRNISVENS